MGNDGGSIPTRRELVKEAARNPTASELKDKQKEHLAHRWSQCPVSHRPLAKPVVADYSGDLYNKDAIIEFLLPAEASSVDKQEYEKFIQGRIKGLKDVVEVQFEVEHDAQKKTDKWICPVTSKELGPNVKAVYLVPCGHAFSQEAIKEMKSEGKCVQCATPYEERDVVPILPSTEKEKAFVMERMDTLKSLGLTHSLKKASGSKKRKANGEGKIEPSTGLSEDTKENKTNGESKPVAANISRTGTPQSGTSTPRSASGIKNTATAGLTARVLAEEEARKKRRRENENISSLYTKSDGQGGRGRDFMTRGFTIPANARHE
ncbi:Replication termination factor 2 [Exophiala xenobiotica]|nr:Replication termination factor 2 [Exophiala xenobiotica]KAK5384151.1 Replication termination factor 2 [Exophiala xenobiotica]KAK5399529.1 Replication termination factor 2 [Exophiala xenobiotica]KAK5416384.1 Replication termination factor 2 [Exophiala xenobiotica]KAK5458532.1 Replication termination factor 2 [Exophiala xenobiotica]